MNCGHVILSDRIFYSLLTWQLLVLYAWVIGCSAYIAVEMWEEWGGFRRLREALEAIAAEQWRRRQA